MLCSFVIRTLIVDDEPLARSGVRRLLEGDADLVIAGECGDGAQAVAEIRRGGVDLVLLDVQMPGTDGFGVLEAIGAGQMPVVVFLTAYDQHAVRAFEAQALDYLMKPFSEERFAAAIARAKREVWQRRLGEAARHLHGSAPQATSAGVAAPTEPYPTRIVVRSGASMRPITVADIEWIEAEDYMTRLHVGAKSHLVRETMQWFEEHLDPARFVRVHRSAIVAVERIVELRGEGAPSHGPSGSGGVILLKSGARVPVSRSRRDQLERLLAQPL
ncbi:MAG: LyTR family two component transcriptional regulator [Gemmatimonadetes bacterium]|nr:LyTR family two component transcriptional regulator [Gemmatimonadota bacterium]